VLLFRQAALGGEVNFNFCFAPLPASSLLLMLSLQTTFGAGLALENVQGEFQFHNVGAQPFNVILARRLRPHVLQVSFLYPSRPNQTILKGLNLTLPAKKLTCIMGPSGCGKSTVMSLLLRLYEPLTGKVTLDGVELSKIDVQFLRSIIALVQQEPVRNAARAPTFYRRLLPPDFVLLELEG